MKKGVIFICFMILLSFVFAAPGDKCITNDPCYDRYEDLNGRCNIIVNWPDYSGCLNEGLEEAVNWCIGGACLGIPISDPEPTPGDECVGEGSSCDDGNVCHASGTCSNGYCVGISNLADDSICGDGRYCEGGICGDVEFCEGGVECSSGKVCSLDEVCLLPAIGASPNWDKVVLDYIYTLNGVQYRLVVVDENVYVARLDSCDGNDCSWIVRPLSYYGGVNSPIWGDVIDSNIYVDDDGNVVWEIEDLENLYITNISSCGEFGCVWVIEPLILLGEAYWANTDGRKISEADKGDSVFLIRNGGGSGDFVIKEDDIAFDEEIVSFSGEIEDVDYIAIWTVEYVEDGVGNPEFYFEVNGVSSNILTVSEDENDSQMVLDIISPKCGDYFDEGQEIEIEVIASDSDDVIDGEVDINGEKVIFSNGRLSFDKRLDDAGNLQIIVSSVNGRGKKSRHISNVMVLDKFGDEYVDGNYVAACIIEPKDFSNIVGNFVKFNASATRGIKVIEGERYLFVPGEDRFSWHWSYYGPGDIEYYPDEYVSTAGEWAYVFNRYFPMSGDNSASLEVDIGSSSGTKI